MSDARSRTLLALFLGVGLVAFAYVWMAVHRHRGGQLASNNAATRAHVEIGHWLERGYFASCGLLSPVPGRNAAYRWSSGGHRISGFLVQKIRGTYSRRLAALHNQLIALLTSALLALLAYRLARRCGVEPLHAFVLGVAAQMVYFTFPDTLALYWELPAQAYALLPAIAFLLLEERSLDGRRKRFTILQAVCIFALTYLEGLCGTMFIAAYLATGVMRGAPEARTTPQLRRLLITLLAPWLLAYAIYGIQLGCTDAQLIGSSFPYRSGLDGDATLYGDHLDIAFGRDAVRAGRPGNPQVLFRWPALFFAGVASLLAVLAAYLRGRSPRIAVVALVTLAGEYLLYAAVVSQAVALHPYLFDIVLAVPLILALFAVAPAVMETLTNRTGVLVLLAFLGAAWLSMFQLRLYALAYPLAP